MISDEGAIEDIMDTHKYTKSKADTAAAAISAGVGHVLVKRDQSPCSGKWN